MLQVGSGEVFSITEDLSLLPDPYTAQCNSTKRDLDCVKGAHLNLFTASLAHEVMSRDRLILIS